MFHCATAAPAAANTANKKLMHDVNVKGTQNMIDACIGAGVPKLVYTSSASVVFDGADLIDVDESAPYASKPIDYYTETKVRLLCSGRQACLAGTEYLFVMLAALFCCSSVQVHRGLFSYHTWKATKHGSDIWEHGKCAIDLTLRLASVSTITVHFGHDVINFHTRSRPGLCDAFVDSGGEASAGRQRPGRRPGHGGAAAERHLRRARPAAGAADGGECEEGKNEVHHRKRQKPHGLHLCRQCGTGPSAGVPCI